MSKKENEQLYGMCEFIYHIYAMASLEVPENFNPEEQAIIVANALKHHGKIEMAKYLLLMEKDDGERKRLQWLIDNKDQNENCIHHNHI